MLNVSHFQLLYSQLQILLGLNLSNMSLLSINDGLHFNYYARFIYTILGLGISLCFITCSGHIAAETANGCCLYIVSS